jgi:hypothetical protein
MLAAAWTTAFLFASTIVVDGDAACLDEAAFTRDLHAVVPSEVDLSMLTVEVLLAPDGDRVRATLLVKAAELDPLARTFEVERAACPSLGRLVARVVARHVAPLRVPTDKDDARGADVAPPVEPALAPPLEEPAHVDAPPVVVEESAEARRFVLRPHAGVGVGGGVWPILGDLRLEVGASLGLEGWPALVAIARGTAVQPIVLGGGQAQLMHGVVGLGATWALDRGWFTIAPRALALAGPALAWGTGFNNGAVVVLPHTGVLGSVTVATRFGLFVDVGGELVVTPARLATQSGASVQMSIVNVYVEAGFAFDLPFGGGAPTNATKASEAADPVKVRAGSGHEEGEPL